MTAERKLSSRAAGAMGWSVLRYGSDQVFGFVIFAVLAHSLEPAAFGIFIIGLAVAEIGRILAQAGLVNSLYYVPKVTAKIADTVFWGNVGLAVIVASLCYFLRYPISSLMGSAQAAPVIGLLAFVVPVTAAGATHMARNLQGFGHRALAIRSLLSGIIGGSLALGAAYAGWGVWALVVHRFAGEVIGTLVAWHAYRWVPGFKVSWRTLKEQLAVGASIASSQILLVALSRAQDVIISRMIGIGAVGIFRISSKINDVVSQCFINEYFSVATPTLSKLKNDLPALRRGYLRMMSLSMMLLFPALCGIGVLADRIIPLAFGAQWEESITIARILCIAAPAFILNLFGEPLFTVLGRGGIIMRLTGVQLVLTVLLCSFSAQYGLFWFAVACAVRSYLTLGLQFYFIKKVVGLRLRDAWHALIPVIGASTIMVAVVWWASNTWFGYNPLHSYMAVVNIGVLSVIGALIYTLSLLVLLRKTGRGDLIAFINGILSRSQSIA